MNPSGQDSEIFLATPCLLNRDKEHVNIVKLLNMHIKLGEGLRRDAFPACCLFAPTPAYVCPGFLHPSADWYMIQPLNELRCAEPNAKKSALDLEKLPHDVIM